MMEAATASVVPRKGAARRGVPSAARHHPHKRGRAARRGPHEAAPILLPTPALLGGKYLLLGPVEGSALYRCVHVSSKEEYVAKVLCAESGRRMVSAHLRMDGHPHVSALREVVWASDTRVCLLLPPAPHGHLHSHVRTRRRLRESEARRLFRQVAATVHDCHQRGLVLRDLKLRKFVFDDPHRTHLRLESLEDAVVLAAGAPDDHRFADYSPSFPSSYATRHAPHAAPLGDDRLEEKRGCPAYVSPEILRSGHKYSGRAADMWSLGVLLYTMLVGRYPFNDSEHASLFAKISRARFGLPDSLSPRARCLVRSLLRREPSERLSAADVLLHPWLAPCLAGRARDEDCDADELEEGERTRPAGRTSRHGDQAVPETDAF